MKRYRLTSILAAMSILAAPTACEGNNPETSQAATVDPLPEIQTISSTELELVRAAASTGIKPIELSWDALIPADWRLDKLLEEYDADNLSDDDPRAQELMEKLKKFWREAPVVHDYDGELVKLPGFVVPIETDAKTIHEFLLVPYYGACIHTPPPPANQTVYVVTEEGYAYRGQLFDTVWVTGILRVDELSSKLGDAGYRIEARLVELFE